MVTYDLPTLGGLRLVKGLCEGVLLGKDAISGFPSLNNLPHTGNLGYHGVNIFQTDSRNETMVVTIENVFEDVKAEDLAKSLLGTRVFVGYPYLQEAHVSALSDNLFRYETDDAFGVRAAPHRPDAVMQWRKTADRLEHTYSKRYGVIVHPVEIVLHARLIKGLKRDEDGALVKEFDDQDTEHPLQTTVLTVSTEDSRYKVGLSSAALTCRKSMRVRPHSGTKCATGAAGVSREHQGLFPRRSTVRNPCSGSRAPRRWARGPHCGKHKVAYSGDMRSAESGSYASTLVETDKKALRSRAPCMGRPKLPGLPHTRWLDDFASCP